MKIFLFCGNHLFRQTKERKKRTTEKEKKKKEKNPLTERDATLYKRSYIVNEVGDNKSPSFKSAEFKSRGGGALKRVEVVPLRLIEHINQSAIRNFAGQCMRRYPIFQVNHQQFDCRTVVYKMSKSILSHQFFLLNIRKKSLYQKFWRPIYKSKQ